MMEWAAVADFHLSIPTLTHLSTIEFVLSDSSRKLQEVLDEFMGKQDPTHKLHPDGVSNNQQNHRGIGSGLSCTPLGTLYYLL